MTGRGTLAAEPAPAAALLRGGRVPEPSPDARRWYTAEEAAEILRMSADWVRDRMNDPDPARRLRAKKITSKGKGAYRTNAEWIEAFMASLPDAGNPRDP